MVAVEAEVRTVVDGILLFIRCALRSIAGHIQMDNIPGRAGFCLDDAFPEGDGILVYRNQIVASYRSLSPQRRASDDGGDTFGVIAAVGV